MKYCVAIDKKKYLCLYCYIKEARTQLCPVTFVSVETKYFGINVLSGYPSTSKKAQQKF